MLYGERLRIAMDRRGDVLGRVVSRKDIAAVAGCSVQNVGMILGNAKGVDQKFGTESHAAVAAYLKVSPEWLLNESGPMDPPRPAAPSHLSPAAIEIAALYDMIPASDKIKRAQAYNAATTAIMQVLQSAAAM